MIDSPRPDTRTPLDYALAELAAGVAEDPPKSNRGIPFDRYALAGEEPGPWCARGLRWCYTQAGLRLPGNRYLIGRVLDMHGALEDRGAILTRGTPWEPGDLLFLHERGQSDPGRGNHVAIIARVDGEQVHSIDGNWGDRWAPVTRDRRAPVIWCAARWPARPTA